MTAPVQAGDLIAGKYEVERVIGQGGMGVVVSAMHKQLNQRVAIKLLRAEGTPDPEVSARFFREARAAVKLRSEHVAKVLDVGTFENNSPFMVMEYLEGEDLGSVTKRGQLDPDDAVRHVLQACEALAEAHAAGIIHRDLKPENLFLTRRSDGSPCVKVLDFGISKMIEQGSGNLTTTGSLMGTPFYMSPEQLRSSRQVDARSDIWALGMILYQLLTGKLAFWRATLPELCAAVLLDDTVPPRELRPDLPESLDRAICRTLEKSPDQRFPSLAEFTAAIAPFSKGGSASARRVATILDVKVEPSSQADASEPSSVADPLGSTSVASASALPSVPPAAPRGSSTSSAPHEPGAFESPALPLKRTNPVLFVIPAVLLTAAVSFLLSRSGHSDAAATSAPASTSVTAVSTSVVPAATSALPVVAVVSAPPVVSAATTVSAVGSSPVAAAANQARTAPRNTATVTPAGGSTGHRPADFGSRQ